MSNKAIWILVLFIVVVIGGIFLASNKNTNQPQYSTEDQANETPIPTPKKINDVKVTKNGFEPKIITINKGETVSWINSSGEDATVNSDPYPNNNKYPFLNLGSFPNGTTVQAIFNDTGTFGYHNQFKSSETGTIMVK
ncbi:MAG TPA: hypothetical protein VHE53_03565 [Patescibacteria group bacterium]|nr:hypothetical protein [Patescibacteria group bacterium]